MTIGQQRDFCKIIIGNTYKYQYRFLLQTGLRAGEMVGLRWSDIDLDNRTLTVNRTMEYRHSTKEWRVGELKSKSGYRMCDKAVIERFSMHVLRHTFATRCIEAGMKPKTLHMILGHSNIGITMNLYVHVTDDEKEKEVQSVEEMLKII